MQIRTFVVAMVLAVAPVAGMAQGCSYGHDAQEAMSCAEGSAWDAKTGTCVKIVTG